MDSDKEQNTIDTHVGNRIRVRRTFLRVSQEKLGEHIGVSFQQIQKYEKGSNRIGAGQLFHIAKLLKVEPNYFYEGLGAVTRDASGFAESSSRIAALPVDESTEGIALNRAFARIRSQKVRRRIVDLVTALADTSQ
jgi:transcriptional regulator with XRE-family HTH domain